MVWWGCDTVSMVGMVCQSVGYGMFDMTVCMVCMGMYGYYDGYGMFAL